ncbi:unnamed protein product [Schistocephalus solidus]|uniref:COesterase domain-containing protein n=1 Tax=Schistocephalus solidus TaxID=70667 RepID=A0A183SUY2_SCHSO|nr:unnamed protein product [Schistocephalus solidus]
MIGEWYHLILCYDNKGVFHKPNQNPQLAASEDRRLQPLQVPFTRPARSGHDASPRDKATFKVIYGPRGDTPNIFNEHAATIALHYYNSGGSSSREVRNRHWRNCYFYKVPISFRLVLLSGVTLANTKKFDGVLRLKLSMMDNFIICRFMWLKEANNQISSGGTA